MPPPDLPDGTIEFTPKNVASPLNLFPRPVD